MKSREVVPVFFFAGIGVFVIWSAWGQGVGSFFSPGAGLMPFCLGIGLTSVSLLLIFLSLKGKVRPSQTSWGKIYWGRVASVIVTLLVYALLLERLGYLIATAILLFLLFTLAGSKRSAAVISSVLTVIVTYFFFTYFGLVFPAGLLRYLGL
jgi:putative tricarboxylic transport membrane protein